MSKTLQLKIITALQDKLSGPLNKIRGASGESAKSLKGLRDKLKGLERTQKQVGQFRDLSKGLSDTSSKMKEAQARVNELAANIKNTSQPTAAMRREFQQATRTADGLKNKHIQQSQELQRLRSSLSGAGVSTKALSQDEKALRGNIARTTEQLEAQRKKLGQVAQQQRKLGEAREKMQRTQALAGSMSAAGAAGLGVGYGVKRLGGNLLAPGISYGSQISELQAVTRLEKGDERLGMLKTQARDLGASTAFSATDVAAGQTFLARAGFTPEAIQSSMKDMLDLALANGTDLARTADIASNISSAFKIDPEVEGNMGRVADVLSAVSARANVDLEMLGETMKYLGQAEGLDVSLEEAAAMAGLLGNIGIQSSQAGTTMRAMLNRLSAPAKEGAKAMKALGLEVTDANGDMLKMPDILESVAQATESMGNAERAAHFKSIFGAEAGSGMAELVKQQGMGALVALITELEDATGENSRMAATRADNIEGDLKGLHSAWEEVGIGVTDLNEGPLRELIQNVTGVIRSIGDWMQRNPELVATIAKVVAVVGILAAVGGTLLLTMASLLGPFAMMRYGMSLLTIKGGGLFSTLWGLGAKALPLIAGAVKSLSIALLTTPIGWAVMAIAASALLIWKYWEPIKAFFSGLWEQVKAAFDGGIAGVTALIVNWSPLGLFYKAFSATLGFFGVEMPGRLSEAGAKMVAGLVGGIKSLGGSLWETVLSLWEEVKQAFNGGLLGVSALIINWSPLGLFYQAFAAVLDYLGLELPGKFTEFGSMMMSGLVAGIKSMGGAVKGAVVGAAESATGWFKEKLGIESPSRVFMGFGENISEGAAIGINSKNKLTLDAVKAMTAGVMAASAAMPAFADEMFAGGNIRFDQRPPITTQAAAGMHPVQQQSNQYLKAGGDNIEIHIHATPGQDGIDIARAVAAELDSRDREKRAQQRSGLNDY